MNLRRFYLAMAVMGTVVPWLFFGSFFAEHGLNILAFLHGLFANDAAGGFSVDVLLSILVFWAWATLDGRKHGVPHWWLIFPAGCAMGLSLALPLYLYMREGTHA